jgi:hypothetical protein
MLDEASFDVVDSVAVKASGGLALEDVDPVLHNRKRPLKPAIHIVAPISERISQPIYTIERYFFSSGFYGNRSRF